MRSKQIINFFSTNGLNLCAIFSVPQLPTTIREPLAQTIVEFDQYQRLVLIGNAGEQLWRFFERNGMDADNPFDTHSVRVVDQFVAEKLGAVAMKMLYPTSSLIPLQQLGKLAGWHHDSPLGLGIHATFGVWFAYRAAFLVDADLPLISEPATSSPCADCFDKPCLTACPAAAVRGIGRFSISACATHRLQPKSSCASQCLSRQACPIAPAHRYPDAQIAYHYAQSRQTLEQWYS